MSLARLIELWLDAVVMSRRRVQTFEVAVHAAHHPRQVTDQGQGCSAVAVVVQSCESDQS